MMHGSDILAPLIPDNAHDLALKQFVGYRAPGAIPSGGPFRAAVTPREALFCVTDVRAYRLKQLEPHLNFRFHLRQNGLDPLAGNSA